MSLSIFTIGGKEIYILMMKYNIKKFQENMGQALRLHGISIKAIPFLLSCSISLIVLYIKNVNTNLTVFYNRAIGHASINGVDAPVRVHVFWICVLIFLLSFIIGNYLINRIVGYIAAKNPAYSLDSVSMLFFELSILLLIDLIMFLMSFVKDRTVQMPVMMPVIFVIVCVHLFMNITVFSGQSLGGGQLLADAVELIAPIPLTYLLMMIVSVGKSTVEIMSWKGLLCYILAYFLVRLWCAKSRDLFATVYTLIPLSFLPLTYIIANEAHYTLTKYDIMIGPKRIAFILSGILFVIAAILYQKKKTSANEIGAEKIFNNVIIPIFLVTLVCFLNHVQTIPPGFDYLHNGNMIVPAQQLYQFGKIPILDYMAPQHWPVGAFLYMFFNGSNYYEPVLWNEMFDYSLCILISYFVLRQFMGARQSALLLCFTPMLEYINTYYYIALLPILYINQMQEKRRIRDYGLVMLLALAAFAYMPSTGKIAVLAGLLLIALSCSSANDVKHAIIGVVCAVLPLATLYFLLVLVRGEGILDRITLISAMANTDTQIGAYTSLISDSRTPFEILTYYGLFPLMGLLSLLFVMRIQKKTRIHFAFLFLIFASIISSLRGLARHCLAEALQTDFYLFIFILIPVVLIRRNKTIQRALVGIVIAIMIIIPYGEYSGLANEGVPDFTFQKFEIGSERCDTVNHSEYPKNLRKVLDSVLTKDQTFFEGINSHLLYTMLERETPFFHHSVQLIFSEPPQEAYIRLFEKAYEDEKIPVIIYGSADVEYDDIDGIPAELSLFKLDDFIYTHYEPWVWVDGFHLWKAKNSNLILPDTDCLLQEISVRPTDSTSVYDLSCQYAGNELILQCGDINPQIVLPFPASLSFDAETNENAELKIVYRSSNTGDLKVFFDFEGFNETDSSTANVMPSQEYHTVYLPVTHKDDLSLALKNIRIDPPNGAKFEIQSISLVSRTLVVEDMDYLQQDFNMWKLPYIWGNYDEKIAKNFPEELQHVSDYLELDSDGSVDLMLDPNIDKEGGNYVYFRIDAAESGTLSIRYGNEIINSCQFDLIPGVQDYLVRISTQYNWVNEQQDHMSIQSSVPIKVETISILKGD